MKCHYLWSYEMITFEQGGSQLPGALQITTKPRLQGGVGRDRQPHRATRSPTERYRW